MSDLQQTVYLALEKLEMQNLKYLVDTCNGDNTFSNVENNKQMSLMNSKNRYKYRQTDFSYNRLHFLPL